MQNTVVMWGVGLKCLQRKNKNEVVGGKMKTGEEGKDCIRCTLLDIRQNLKTKEEKNSMMKGG